MNRSLLRWAALLALTITLFTACEQHNKTQPPVPTPAEETIKLVFWAPFSGGDGSFMRELVNEYNESNTDHVTVELINNNSDEYYTRLPTAIVTDEAPDVAIVHASRFAQFVNAGFLTNIQDMSASMKVDWSGYNPKILGRTTVNGDHYAIPLDTHFDVMYYNKHWIQQAGLLNADGTLKLQAGEDGFLDFLSRLRDRIPSSIAPLALPNTRSDAYWLWWSLYNQMNGGGTFYGKDGRSASINNPLSLKALKYVNGLYTEGYIPPDLSDTLTLFAQGKAALLILGVWSSGTLEHELGDDLGVAPIPVLYDHPAVWGDSHTLAFPAHDKSNPKKLKASIRFAEWISQHGGSWARAGHIPGNLAALQSDDFLNRKYSQVLSGEVSHVVYFPNHPYQGETNDLMSAEFTKMLHHELTPEQLLQSAEAQITKLMQELSGE